MTLKDNYRPINILPSISKIYERCLNNQSQTYLDKTFSKNEGGFRKRFNAEHCLVSTIEQLEESVDNGEVFCILIADLFKAFGCLYH